MNLSLVEHQRRSFEECGWSDSWWTALTSTVGKIKYYGSQWSPSIVWLPFIHTGLKQLEGE